jgi:serpin B
MDCGRTVRMVGAFGLFVILGRAQGAAETERVAVDANDSAFALHRALRTAGENGFHSPFSVAEAFEIVRECVEGEVAKEIDAAFRFPEGAATARARLREAVSKADAAALKTANRLWINSAAEAGTYREEILARLESRSEGGVARVDFSDSEGARRKVNDWTKDRTDGRIPEILPQGRLDVDTRLVVTNAVHFKALWETPFDPKKTRERPFKVGADETVSTPMMSGPVKASFATGAAGTFVEIPYRGGDYAFFGALPAEGASLESLENAANGGAFAAWRKSLVEKAELPLLLPKFKLEISYKLHERGLPEVGMKRAFEYTNDWRPLVGEKDRIRISYVGHKAFVEVDEEGTEAAAATVVVAKRAGGRPAGFFADRPFLFAIVHRPTGLITFMGRYARPAKNG